jgi:hypothetical protein
MCRSSTCGVTLLAVAVVSGLAAQERESIAPSRGFTLYERFQGSFSSLGAVTRLDTTVGYNFDSHFSVAGGIPIYFVHPSSSSTATTGVSSANGIGNVYGQFRLTLANPIVNYASTLTISAPTGDQGTGFSTGQVTADWSNYFERSLAKLTPFADIGIANSVSDTLFFVRPYTTLGFVTHIQGGARYHLVHGLNLGGSVYAIEPRGQQTVVSRLVATQPPASPSGNSNGKGRNQGVFETANITTGPAGIARDHGLSTWLQVSPASALDLYAGYTRSTQFDLDTFFFGVGVSLGKVFRHLGYLTP